ncbi:S41 family peptidase [Syntrophaceticus schinkii]|uniref:C-terminal processing peptidase n=1 Tax=Syntrophaceticus schinkii TaxID=499207 RepID=A0A0B7MB60_9FIRM|nr:S41 family peptidase [Syntrophaceticus schinkii]MDD4262259.1 S41 family peptidase [Syntrophaceticus schinkii]MDD4675902.1 S41 family peptidase [Syntrophaceticus schinkii]CEO87724.1 C-terminal processing peptidase [Syntrophaceticus schinkii]
MDRLKTRGFRITATVLIILLIAGAVGGLFYWVHKNNLKKLVSTYFLIKSQYLNEVSTATLVNGAVKGMVEALDDPYSVYLDEEAFKELNLQIEGTFGGIGVEIDMDQDKQLVVVSPLPETPAARAGIKSGDVIAKINDQETTNMTTIEAAGVLRGKPGTTVSLEIMRKEEKRSFTVQLTREQIAVPSVSGEMLEDYPGIGYLRVLHFNRASTNAQLFEELKKLQDAQYRGLVLDLRGNPGGDLQAAVEVAGYFLKEGPVVRIVHREGAEDVLYPTRIGSVVKVPLVVLIDEGSASASEIVAGAIKDSESGVLVGTRTFGKGLVQTVFNMGGKEGVKLTTNKYLTPDRHDIHKKGIKPDVVVKQPEDMEKDLQLDKAVEVLEKQLQEDKKAA